MYTSYVTPKGQPRTGGERLVKTTVELPEMLWKAAKNRAVDERTDLRTVIIAGLEAYLRTKPRKGSF